MIRAQIAGMLLEEANGTHVFRPYGNFGLAFMKFSLSLTSPMHLGINQIPKKSFRVESYIPYKSSGILK